MKNWCFSFNVSPFSHSWMFSVCRFHIKFLTQRMIACFSLTKKSSLTFLIFIFRIIRSFIFFVQHPFISSRKEECSWKEKRGAGSKGQECPPKICFASGTSTRILTVPDCILRTFRLFAHWALTKLTVWRRPRSKKLKKFQTADSFYRIF